MSGPWGLYFLIMFLVIGINFIFMLAILVPALLMGELEEWMSGLSNWDNIRWMYDYINDFATKHSIASGIILVLFCISAFVFNDLINSIVRSAAIGLLFYFLFPSRVVVVIIVVSSISACFYGYYKDKLSHFVSVLLSTIIMMYLMFSILLPITKMKSFPRESLPIILLYSALTLIIPILLSCLVHLHPKNKMLKSFISKEIICAHYKKVLVFNIVSLIIAIIITLRGAYKCGIFVHTKIVVFYISVSLFIIASAVYFILQNYRYINKMDEV